MISLGSDSDARARLGGPGATINLILRLLLLSQDLIVATGASDPAHSCWRTSDCAQSAV